MNHRCTAAVFAQIICRLHTCVFDPAKVQFSLELVCGNCLIKIIKAIGAVFEGLEFKIVIVIEKRKAGLTHILADLGNGLHSLFKLLCTGTTLFCNVRDNKIFASYHFVSIDNGIEIINHVNQGDMCRDRIEFKLFAPGLYLFRRVAEKAGEFNTVITHLLDSLQSAVKIIFHIAANAVKLHADGGFLLFWSILAGKHHGCRNK